MAIHVARKAGLVDPRSDGPAKAGPYEG
jgi:hypothetical protein